MPSRGHVSFLLLWILAPVHVDVCEDGWFGLSCKFKCRCVKCNDLGECTGDNRRCLKGWFGPKCQYRNVLAVFEVTSVPSWISDEDDSTCNPNSLETTVVITMKVITIFTWMRLVFTKTESRHVFSVSITEASINVCKEIRRSVVQNTTLDVFCQSTDPFKQLRLSGPSIANLCSVYISMGRNVALRHWTNQSSTFERSVSSLAVEGNSEGSYATCSITMPMSGCETDEADCPAWNLFFTRPYLIRMFNFTTTPGRKSKYIKFRTYREDGQKDLDVLLQTDTKYIFALQDFDPKPITRIRLSVFKTYKPLIICELEMYGEPVCPEGLYGLDCEETCRCKDISEDCLTPTGVCLEGCKRGFYGNNCDRPCGLLNCTHCDRYTGVCIVCPAGYMGHYCNTECKRGFYGVRCAHVCSAQCRYRTCNAVNGECFLCSSGYYKSHCDTADCRYGTYYCNNKCSPVCLKRSCKSATGDCMQCPAGHRGPRCEPTNYSVIYFAIVSFVIFLSVAALVILYFCLTEMTFKYTKAKLKRARRTRRRSTRTSLKGQMMEEEEITMQDRGGEYEEDYLKFGETQL